MSNSTERHHLVGAGCRMLESPRRRVRVPYTGDAWDAAPVGSWRTTDLPTGEQWIELADESWNGPVRE
jgi:hypothetical protein